MNHRHLLRDSFFLMAEVRLLGSTAEYRVKVRNLSAGGMMAEGQLAMQRGSHIEVNLRNIGWVQGVVAWIQDNRFGIALVQEIDPKLARASMLPGESTPRFVKPPISIHGVGPVRKV